DAKGNVFAGTGTQGKIYRISPSGKGEVLADTDEIHVRALALTGDGSLIAGTEGKGLLLSVTPTGKISVITNSPLGEITALVLGPSGRIYFATVGQSGGRGAPRQAPTPPPPARPAAPGGPEETPPGQPAPQPENPPPPAPTPTPPPPVTPPAAGLETRVVAVEPDGYAREIWSATGDLILALALDSAGNVVAGAGTEGKVLRIDPVRGESTLLNKADSAQITGLLSEPDGSILVAGSNLGAVYRLGGRVAPEGTYESSAYDTRVFSTWGKVAWRA